MTAPPHVLLFDVNETMLDLAALRPAFAAVLGSAEPMSEWFARMLHGSLVSNHLGAYRSFDDIGAEALTTLATRRGVAVDDAQAAGVVAGMRSLPPHPDVLPALGRLRTAGYRLVTLTNGSYEVAAAQLAGSGIDGYIEQALSVDEVRRFKPAPEVYLLAAAKLDVDLDDMVMVSSHDWDILGARSVGIAGAFAARPNVVWGSHQPQPDLTVPDLGALADALGA